MFNVVHPLKSSILVAASLIVTATIAPLASATSDPNPLCTSAGKKVTCTWDTPGSYIWTVPKDATKLSFDVIGAQGGSASYNGGNGGQVTVSDIATLPDSWKELQIDVGGQGQTIRGEDSGGVGGGGQGSAVVNSIGSGGGGRSEIRVPNHFRLVVAGGGGGAGTYGAGGAGSGTDGKAGDLGYDNSGAGGGGSHREPGGGGKYLLFCKGQAGKESGKGGDANSCMAGAGGGGGGWTGGGGATSGAGGGGGSGYAYPGLGSETKDTGVNQGNGKVIVTYTAP